MTSTLDPSLVTDPALSGLDASTLTRALYSTDSSIYRVIPQAVATPTSREELIDVVRAALAAKLPITMRGAGTSCSGNAVGEGLVIDTSRHLNHVLAIDPQTQTATIEPGVIQSQLQRAAAPYGLRYGPDPSTSNRCTVGGMIGNNACGPRALGYGRSADTVVELEVITGNGKLVTLRKGEDFGDLRELVANNLATIRTEFGTFSRQISGYSLEHLLPENGFDLPKFFAGTEGTLGVIVQAKVQLTTDHPQKVTVALGYPTMPEAADDIMALLPFKPVACEGMDRRLTDVVARRNGADAVPTLPAGDAWMFIELVGDDAAEVAERAHAMMAAAAATEGWVITDPIEAAPLWAIRSDAAGLAGVALDAPAYPGWEDSAVPPAKLGAYLRDFEDVLAAHGMHGLPYGHFGEGCVHCRVDFPFDDADGLPRYRDFLIAAAKLAAKYGGSMSGEHGDGRARSELLPLMYSPAALALFGQVKTIFDPENLLNPGVLVDPKPFDVDVRVAQSQGSKLRRIDPGFAADVHHCSGVGKCRADNGGLVMCPSFRATGDEKDSTRGRSRVLQEMINGELITGGWRASEVHEALDLCLACKGCRHDCPAGVDMADYKSRLLEHAYKGRIRPIGHYALGWLPRWGRLVTKLHLGWLGNIALQTPGLKHLMRAVVGVDQRRPMPRFRRGSSARAAAKVPAVAGTNGPVAVWVDSFSDAFEGQQLTALISTLIAAGFEPQVITDDVCCGLTWITTGQREGARRQLRHALDILAPIVDEGIPVVGMEPSCMAVWRSDAPDLVGDDERLPRVAAGIVTLAELLNRVDFPMPNLNGHTIVAQPHCHQASVLGWSEDTKLLAKTGANVVTVKGCCGLAGNFGVEKGHYEVSVKVAENDLLPAIKAAGSDAVLLADGFSCRKQIADLEGSQALTLAQLIASHLE